MSLASGFESGFNLALKFNQQKLDEERQKKQLELTDTQIKAADTQIKAAEQKMQTDLASFDIDAEKKRSETRKNEAMVQSYNAGTTLKEAQTQGVLTTNAANKILLDHQRGKAGWMEANSLIDHFSNLPTDPQALEEHMYFGEATYERLKAEGFDFLEIATPKVLDAYLNLQPVLESGDFTKIGPSFADDLTTIYKSDINLFKGKQFISNDGEEGSIVDIRLNGDIVGKENGLNAVIGATFTVDVDGEQKEFEGFLPDLSGSSVQQDLEGVDAKAVSIRDATDTMSALRTVAAQFSQNPNLIKAAEELGKFKIQYQEDLLSQGKKEKGETPQKLDMVTVRDTYNKAMDNFFDAKALSVTDLDLKGTLVGQEEEVSAAIQTFAFYMPTLKTEKSKETDLFIIPKEYGGNLGKYFASVQPRLAQFSEEVAKLQFADNNLKDGQRAIYTFGNLAIAHNTPRKEYKESLADLFGIDDIDALIDGAPFELNDEELLDYLYMQLVEQ